ncbi:MAG: aspartate-semialdehyde dehydrogenase [Enterococcus aquimarinus]|uniref:Aspartate-semialdehyde dehydrogenase n=1 Tax=Enterococcus aquimarinus TaxID=328396 RepID=A0A9E4A2M1_9ENTE|nr:aspartate-semialdehyde dehydrogenase [Enterococcus aquimarinus]
MGKKYTVAVVGATGAVGTKMLELLQEVNLPIERVKALASKRSAGKTLAFKDQVLTIEELTADSFEGVDIALFSAGGGISEIFAPEAVKRGAVVIDNTSHFRMVPGIPLVVPEVNPESLKTHQGIIANPNCSTIQMMVALEPLRQAFGLDKIIVSTYQAVSGAGAKAIAELENQVQEYLDGKPLTELTATILPSGGDKKHYPIAFNALPQIDVFGEEGYTLEEWKMINETKKIMGDESIKVAATCVRVPIVNGHSESIYIELKEETTVQAIQEILAKAPGVELVDDPSQQRYPQAIDSIDQKGTFVGRIRRDLDNPKGFHLWVVSDNLLKGAALNSIQIAEKMHELALI